MDREKGITQRVLEAIREHERKHHGARAVRPWMLGDIVLKSYTDATRPSASAAGAGAIIYNSDDSGINVSDGANWRAPGADGGWVVT